MGWKGTLRAVNSSLRAMERDAQRRQRAFARQEAQDAKRAELMQAASEVAEFEALIDRLTSIHKADPEPVNWTSVAAAEEPIRPAPSTRNQERAQAALLSYEPGFFTRLFGREAQERAKLERAVISARERDAAETSSKEETYCREFDEWKASHALAAGVLEGRPDAMTDAIRQLNPFSEISGLGSYVDFRARENGRLTAEVHVNGEEVIPTETKSLLQSGKLSIKKMPKGRYYELYQDYVCSCVFRVGTELLALLPINSVLVTASTPLLNTASGHVEEQAILSVFMPRSTVERLNLELIDPSDALSNFIYRMAFKKTKGFGPVQPLTYDDVSESSSGQDSDDDG